MNIKQDFIKNLLKIKYEYFFETMKYRQDLINSITETDINTSIFNFIRKTTSDISEVKRNINEKINLLTYQDNKIFALNQRIKMLLYYAENILNIILHFNKDFSIDFKESFSRFTDDVDSI